MRGSKALFAWLLVIALAGPLGVGAQQGTGSLAGPVEPTIIVRMAPETFRTLGADQVASAIDYGGYLWVEMTPAQAAALDQAGVAYEPQPHATRIGLSGHAFDTRQGEPLLPQALGADPKAEDAGFFLVQFVAPPRDEWLKELAANGLRVLQYVPQNAYLVWGPAARAQLTQATAAVRWTGAYHPAYKIATPLTEREGRIENVNVLIYDDGQVKDTLAMIEDLGGRYVHDFPMPVLLQGRLIDAIFELDRSLLEEVARIPNVLHLDYASPQPGLDDEVSDQIVAGNHAGGVPYNGYQTWLSAKGVDGAGVIIADVDTGLDTNDNATAHPDIQGRIAAFVDYSGGSHLTDDHGHGTHTGGAIAGNAALGDSDPNGFLYGLGVAPASELVVQNALWSALWPPSGGWQRLSKDSVTHGAVASSNSWYTGATGAQGYSSACVTHDLMIRDANLDTATVAEPLIMVFSAGNSGPGASTITEPKEAKNLIVVGASENYRPDNPLGAFCGASSDIEGVVDFSSRGPALDGRLSPTLVAPGSDVASLRSYSGTYSGCGQVVDEHSDYAYMSGTSMACPHVSGGVALITEWWKDFHAGAVPSPAMVKALLVNGADDMGPADIPNNDEGWGRMNLDHVINSGQAVIAHDQEHLLTASGETWTLPGGVADPGQPLKITLAWTDAPGFAGGDAWVNDLDLEVTVGGIDYKGNDFAGGWSTTGGPADYRNNVENVYVQSPGAADVTVRVLAAFIVGDGVPYNGDATDQDFGLVATNMVLEPDFTLSASPEAYEVCAPGAVTYDLELGALLGYDEQVTLALDGAPPDMPYGFEPGAFVPPGDSELAVTATGSTPAGSHPLLITATGADLKTHTAEVDLSVSHAPPPAPALLVPAEGATGVTLEPTFEWLPVPESSRSRIQVATDPTFEDTLFDVPGLAGTTYGSPVALPEGGCVFWRLDGDNGCGEGSWSEPSVFKTLSMVQAFADDMESGGGQWSHAAGQGDDGWALTAGQAHSPSHSWFSPDVPWITDDYLWTAVPFALPGDATLSFWHSYDLEASLATGFDGGVLEISTDGGSTWADLGPSITTHPYNHTMSTGYGSPIGGRQAWSGDSSGWVQVEADLAAYADQTVQLRWRLACDSSISDEGWYVDDVRVVASSDVPIAGDLVHDAGFTVGPALRSDLELTFSAAATGSEPIDYAWEFGDDATGSGVEATHTYEIGGSYPVTLTATNGDGCGYDRTSQVLSICDSLSSVGFTISDDPALVDEIVTFTASAGGDLPIHYKWDLGDGHIGQGNPATHAYEEDGEFQVTLTVTNCTDAEMQAEDWVTVYEPVHDLEITVPPSLRTGVGAPFGATAGGTEPIAYSWSFDDGGSDIGPSPVHTYTVGGAYTVTVTADNPGEQPAQAQAEVSVCGSAYDAAMEIVPDPTLVGGEVHFTAWVQGTEPFEYAWDFDEGGTASGQEASYVFDSPGTYTVTLSITNCLDALVEVTRPLVVFRPEYTWYLPVISKE